MVPGLAATTLSSRRRPRRCCSTRSSGCRASSNGMPTRIRARGRPLGRSVDARLSPVPRCEGPSTGSCRRDLPRRGDSSRSSTHASASDFERHQRATRVDLHPFDGDELEAQVVAMLETPTKRLMAAIQMRSEGNALFAEELIASGDPTGELPTSVGAALLQRTAGLSPATRSVLRAAAVAGRSAPYEILRLSATRSRPARRSAPRGSRRKHPGSRTRKRALPIPTRCSRRRSIKALPGERRRLHGSVAEAIEGTDEDGADTTDVLFELAYHWFEARNRERALRPLSLPAMPRFARLPTAKPSSLRESCLPGGPGPSHVRPPVGRGSRAREPLRIPR